MSAAADDRFDDLIDGLRTEGTPAELGDEALHVAAMFAAHSSRATPSATLQRRFGRLFVRSGD